MTPCRHGFPRAVATSLAALASMLLASCGALPTRTPSPPPAQAPQPPPADLASIPDAAPRAEPRSRRGNPPFYDVMGKRYFVLAGAEGYRERGVASWYGPTFHAKETSNGEPYDMYAMTAAHKTLPLPCYARVTNLANGRSIVVRINDRGPFVGNRLIDLSYTAAWKLDMLRAGTAFVEVEVITPAAATPPPMAPGARLFVQAGAFGVEANALRLAARLRGAGITNVLVLPPSGGGTLYRVRVGPVGDVATYDQLVGQLAGLGVEGRLAGD